MFYADACFSSITHEQNDPDLTYCLLPFDDLKQHKTREFIPRDESPFFCFLSDEDPNLGVQPYCFENAKNTFEKMPQLNYAELREQFANNLLEKSSTAVINMNKKTEELRQMVFEQLGFDTKISPQSATNLVEIFDARVDNKLSKDKFNKQFKQIIEQIKTENAQQGVTTMRLLGDWKELWVRARQNSYKTLCECLTIKNGVFAGHKMELRFLQYFATAVKSKSSAITAETYAKAYLEVLKAEGMTEENARKKINDILNHTIKQTEDSFKLPGCKSDFAEKAKRRLAFRQEFREKRERAKQRREERLKQQETKTYNSTDTTNDTPTTN